MYVCIYFFEKKKGHDKVAVNIVKQVLKQLVSKKKKFLK